MFLLCNFLSKDNLSWALGLVATVRFALLSTTLLHHFSPQTLPCLPPYRSCSRSSGLPWRALPKWHMRPWKQCSSELTAGWLPKWFSIPLSNLLVGWQCIRVAKGKGVPRCVHWAWLTQQRISSPPKPNSSKCAWLTSPRSQVWRPLSSYVERGIKVHVPSTLYVIAHKEYLYYSQFP